MEVEIVPVWKQVTPELAQELMAFWRENNAIGDDAAAAARALQAVCVARDESGALCGVATAMVKVLPRLRQPLYYYRLFFAKALRGQQQFLPVYVQSKQILQGYNASLQAPESLGLLLELENGKFAAAYRHAHEPAFDASFIGYSPRGLQLRVSWFDGAVLLPPAPMPGPAMAGRDPRHHDPSRISPTTRRGNARS